MKYLAAAALFAAAGCSGEDELVVLEKPNSFALSLPEDSELQVIIPSGAEVGVNGRQYPVMTGGVVNMHDIPGAEAYLVYYPATATLPGDGCLDYTLPEVQRYRTGSVDPAAFPIYCLTDNDGLGRMPLRAACGALKLTVPANAEFGSLTSVELAAKEWVLTGDIRLDARTGVVAFREKASQKVVLEGAIDINEDREVLIALPPLRFRDEALSVTLNAAKGQGTCAIDLKGASIEAGKVLAAPELRDIKWVSTTKFYGRANSVLVAPGTTSVTVDCAPYYTTSLKYACEYNAGDPKLTASSAALLWNDVSTGFVTGVTLAADGKSFTATLNGQCGNAVVAIYDDAGTILWSFHLWVTEANDQPLGRNAKGNSLTMLDRNLGAVSAEPDDWRSIGLLYEWGRKDPFAGAGAIGASGVSQTPMYDANGPVSMKKVAGGTGGTIAYSIANPMTFIMYAQSKTNEAKPAYAYDWLLTGDNALWGNAGGESFPALSTLVKTVYDPCPEGYMVAPWDLFWSDNASGANDTERSIIGSADAWDAANVGFAVDYNGQRLWFPSGGLLNRKTAAFSVDGKGYYWSSSPSAANGAYTILSSGSVTFKNNNRGNGYLVRCVRTAK